MGGYFILFFLINEFVGGCNLFGGKLLKPESNWGVVIYSGKLLKPNGKS